MREEGRRESVGVRRWWVTPTRHSAFRFAQSHLTSGDHQRWKSSDSVAFDEINAVWTRFQCALSRDEAWFAPAQPHWCLFPVNWALSYSSIHHLAIILNSHWLSWSHMVYSEEATASSEQWQHFYTHAATRQQRVRHAQRQLIKNKELKQSK